MGILDPKRQAFQGGGDPLLQDEGGGGDVRPEGIRGDRWEIGRRDDVRCVNYAAISPRQFRQ